MWSLRAEARRRPARARWQALVLALAGAAALSACATASGPIKAGREAERAQDYDRAVVEYQNALRQRPNDYELRQALERVKLRASQEHHTRARRFAGSGKLEEAVLEYQIALELNPTSGDIERQLRDLRAQLRAKMVVGPEGRTRLESLIEQSKDFAPIGFDIPRTMKLADSLVFKNAPSRDILTAIGHFAGINVVFDPQFRDQTLTVDLRNSTLEDALQGVTSSTRNFYRVSAAKTITVIPDTPAKRREYEEEIIRTFFLSNADVKETLDLLRLVVDNRRISAVTGVNAIAIKDTPEKISSAAKLISAIDKARAEVVIDVELLEVDRTRLREYGLQIASPGSPGIDGSIDVNRAGQTLQSLRNLTQSDVFVTGVPGLYYRLLKTEGLTRALASPQLRTADGIASQARFGDDVPVPSVTFAPIATGGVNQQPITSFTYRTIGVNIDITPRLHHNDDISLRLKLEVSNLSGVGYQNLPTFGTRYVETTIRLRDGETNMLAGLIRDDERTTLDGVPGLSDLPIVGRLFAKNHRETKETDIVLMITPRIIRVLDLTENDLRPFRVGRDGSGGVYEIPLPAQPQQPQQQPPAQPPEVDPNLPGVATPGMKTGPPGGIYTPPRQPDPTPAKPPVKPPS
jgi:general secretion pathway protein D